MKYKSRPFLSAAVLLALLLPGSCSVRRQQTTEPPHVSGIYPALAFYNNEGECGTGAVVPWAGRLWAVTYGPHLPLGSSDKLYEITPDYRLITRHESIGGTPANRMIHAESGQLFIGPYAIDSAGRVRVIPYSVMPGRHTANARHLYDPAHYIYYGTMEEGLYEVNVHTLAVKELFRDGNFQKKTTPGYAPEGALLPGVHGKGMYSGQGVVVFSNNGEGSQEALERADIRAGVLAEWDGKQWRVIRRNQFTEVTGPGGISGNPNPATDPIWATGWDHRSLLLGVRESHSGWTFYRLPKASHSYDGAHGWNTEWPRIRNVGTPGQPDYLMTMHGMFWRFPARFCSAHSGGLRPRSAYLKVIGDFTRWNNRLVFGCDDAAQKEFLNSRKAKGGIQGPGQSNSNLWFTPTDMPDRLGPATAEGSVWLSDTISAGQHSDAFLFAGWPQRMSWVLNEGSTPVTFRFEIDAKGNNCWTAIDSVNLLPGASVTRAFSHKTPGEWIRVCADRATIATVVFTYGATDRRRTTPDAIFRGMAPAQSADSQSGLLYALGHNRRTLGLLAATTENGHTRYGHYYELDSALTLKRKPDTATAAFIQQKMAIPKNVVDIQVSSVLVTDDKGRRWRLPLGPEPFRNLTDNGALRVCREVATERDLFSCMGTFYELPAENADGYAKIRPIASHPFRIQDYASYRGMLILTGIAPDAANGNAHIIRSDDGQAAVWVGAIDDLWKLGKPVGHGGPWLNDSIKAGTPSDPYLAACYDRKTLHLSHHSPHAVTFTLEADPTGNGTWMAYARYQVKPGQTLTVDLPDAFQARWVRFLTDTDTRATVRLDYR